MKQCCKTYQPKCHKMRPLVHLSNDLTVFVKQWLGSVAETKKLTTEMYLQQYSWNAQLHQEISHVASEI